MTTSGARSLDETQTRSAKSTAAARQDQRRYFVFGLPASVPVGLLTAMLTTMMPALT